MIKNPVFNASFEEISEAYQILGAFERILQGVFSLIILEGF